MRIKIYLGLLVTIVFFTLQSCRKSNKIADDNVNRNVNRIKQSFRIADDNVNIKDLRIQNIRIREVSNFYYNTNNLLDSLEVFTDSTQTVLEKSMNFRYIQNRVRATIYHNVDGRATVDFYYDANKRLTKISDTLGLDSVALYFNYQNNKISEIKIKIYNTSLSLTNFVFDGNNNIIQYIQPDSRGFIKVQLSYDYTHTIPQDLDIRFASAGIKYLYIGGTNITSLIGLNTGLGNTHRIMTRKETNLFTNQFYSLYQFDYTQAINNNITNRTITVNDTIQVFYEYKY